MSETAAFEKAKPTDAELRGELEALTAKRSRMQSGITEIDDRIATIKKTLNVKGN
jgi:hypothetical protein